MGGACSADAPHPSLSTAKTVEPNSSCRDPEMDATVKPWQAPLDQPHARHPGHRDSGEPGPMAEHPTANQHLNECPALDPGQALTRFPG